jgi:hypothetical protein
MRSTRRPHPETTVLHTPLIRLSLFSVFKSTNSKKQDGSTGNKECGFLPDRFPEYNVTMSIDKGHQDQPSVAARPGRKRRVTILSLVTAVALLVCVVVWRRRAPEVGEPFDVEAFAAFSLPDEKNAFTHYRKATQLLVRPDTVLASEPAVEPQQLLNSQNQAEEGWEHAIPAVRRWVLMNRGSLDELQRGAELAGGIERRLSDFSDRGISTGDSSILRECARLEAINGARLTAEGRPVEAWVCYRTLLRLSRHMAMHGTLISRFSGGAVVDLAVRGGTCWAANRSVGAAELKQAIRDVLSVEEMRTPPSDTIKVEYLSLRAFAERGVVEGTAERSWVRFTGYPADLGRTARLVVANLLSQADCPRNLRTRVHPGEMKLFELDPASAPDPMLWPPEEIERLSMNDAGTVAKMLNRIAPKAASEIDAYNPRDWLCSLYGASLAEDTAQTHRKGLLLALALQLHYREHANFPASLDELVKNGYLKSIPADPFGKGEPFRYRRESGPRGAAVVWSVWVDGIDQGGITIDFASDDWGLRVSVPGTTVPGKKPPTEAPR